MFKTITKDNLYKIAKKEKDLYVIKFGHDMCGACKTLEPVLVSLDKHNPKLNIYEVDTNVSPDVSGHFAIRSVPTVIFCRKREVLYSVTGVVPEAKMQYVINNIDDSYFKEHGKFKDETANAKSSKIFMIVTILAVLALLVIISQID